MQNNTGFAPALSDVKILPKKPRRKLYHFSINHSHDHNAVM
jgi:hypothetical protein